MRHISDSPLAALVLVGGYGTRLRPLTFYRSKPLVEFCNKPMVEYILDALTEVGVTKIVFALTEYPKDLKHYIRSYRERHPTVTIIPSIESEPLGTAGPIALAREHLHGHRFFVLNSDIISRYPFKELLEFHLLKGGEGTMMSWDVEDPSRFGVILSDENQRITHFVEKPQIFVGSAINAGHYIFEPSVINRIRPVRMSIETEVFPQMAREGVLYVMPLKGFWMDIGAPQAFIDGIPIFLENDKKILIDHTAQIASTACIGPNVVIGADVRVADGCRIENAVILAGATIGTGSVITNSVIGWRSKIGNWVSLFELCILGEKVTVRDRIVMRGTRVSPYMTIERSSWEPEIVM